MSTTPRYVLVCTEFDGSDTCIAQAWAPEQSALPALPTLDQAELIGGLILAGLVGIRAMQYFLSPPSTHEED